MADTSVLDEAFALLEEEEPDETTTTRASDYGVLDEALTIRTDPAVAQAVAETGADVLKEMGFGRNIAVGLSQAGLDFNSLVARLSGLLGNEEAAAAADQLNRMAQSLGQSQAMAAETSGAAPAIVQRGVTSTARSLATMAPAATVGGGPGAIALFGAVRTNQAITEGRDRGLKGAELAKYAATAGAIEAGVASIFQMAGLGGLEAVGLKQAVYLGLGKAMKQIGVKTLQEIPEEVITEVLDNVNQATQGKDPEQLKPSVLAQTVADTVVATIMSVGAAEGTAQVSAAGNVAVRDIVTQRAEQRALREEARQSAIEALTPPPAGRPQPSGELFPEAETIRKLSQIERPSRQEFQKVFGSKLPEAFQNAEARRRAVNDARRVMGLPPLPEPTTAVPAKSEETPEESSPPPKPQQSEPDDQREPVPTSSPPSPTPETEPARSPQVRLARRVADELRSDRNVDDETFFRMADEEFGGTRAEGKYGPSEAYDALELGVNQRLLQSTDPRAGADQAKEHVRAIGEVLSRVPRQKNRSGEKDTLQQFSTPPDYAYVAAWAANIGDADVVLEPSAGTGNLVVQAANAQPKAVVANEIDPQRAELARELAPTHVLTEDAEQIHNILPARGVPKPTVVLMNPPFSRAGTRLGAKRVVGTDLRHIEAALDTMEDGGRLVAIAGAPLHGEETRTFEAWAKRIGQTADIRANVTVGRDVYKGYGTTFPTRLLIIDKTGPTRDTIGGEASTLEDLIGIIEGIRNDRNPAREQQPTEPQGQTGAKGGRGGRGPGIPVQSPAGGVDVGESPGSDTGQPGEIRGPATPEGVGTDERGPGEGPDVVEPGEPGGVESGGAGESTGGSPVGEPAGGISLDEPSGERRLDEGELEDVLFEPYKPSKVRIEGAKPHPGSLVESAAMSAVELPDPTYTPHLPKEIVENGDLSEAQLEQIVYAGQAHEQMLPALPGEPSFRRGYMIGDGTGVGKGRTIAGIILDNVRRGRKKAVWVSAKRGLFGQAVDDWTGIRQGKDFLFSVDKVAAKDRIKPSEGVFFTTYDTLGQKPKRGAKDRIQQIVEWVGKDFDGVLVFDESHYMANALSEKDKATASQRALAGVELQKRLPNARIVYVSATAATEVRNVSYMDRLGLWGPETPFANKREFIAKIQSGGVAAMELVAQNLKAMGSYLARSLSFNDGTPEGTVEYRRLEHALTDEQVKTYDSMADAWQIVLQNIDAALAVVAKKPDGKIDSKTRSRVMSVFWSTHQRCFNQVLVAMQTPAILPAIEQDIKEGRSVLIQLTNTNEASLTRALAERDEDTDFEDMDLSPRRQLMEFVEGSFPVQQMEEYVDDDGNIRLRPAVDSEGNPIVNQRALAMRQALLDQLSSLRVPDSPLDFIINHFGQKAVSEVTGRSRRLVRDEEGNLVPERRSRAKAQVDIQRFMEGKTRILIFSDAGGTGASYHASLKAQNQQRRSHYVLQPGWRADNALQGMGRSHRSNQSFAPIYTLVHTDLKGQKRFVSSIARRLDQLGALTRGQRQAGSTGLFNAGDNLEGQEAADALVQFYRDLHQGNVNSITVQEFEFQTGLRLVDDNGRLLKNLPPITQFLNRVLSMRVDLQNRVFDEFDQRFQQKVDQALADGTLDQGVETLKAEGGIDKVDDRVVHTDRRSRATAKYVRLSVKRKQKTVSWDEINRPSRWGGRKPRGFVRTPGGKLVAVFEALSKTDAQGNVIDQYRLVDQKAASTFIERSRLRAPEYTAVKENAEAQWTAEVEKVPAFHEQEVHMITGLILPIWDILPGKNRVVRARTREGETMIGRVIPPGEIREVLERLGVKASFEEKPRDPSVLAQQLINGEITVELANGWKLKRSRVGGEMRIELAGPGAFDRESLEKVGLFFERINFTGRFFVPIGPRAGDIIHALTQVRPVVKVTKQSKRSSISGDQARTASRTGSNALTTPLAQAAKPKLGSKILQRNGIIQKMARLLKVPIRTGRIRQGGGATKLGIYKILPEVVRLHRQHSNDLYVAAHEVGHHIDKTTDVLKNLNFVMTAELKALDYDPKKQRAFEGFAEFMAFLMTTDDAQQKAPAFYDYFVNLWLPAHPDLQAKLQEIRSDILALRAANPEDRVTFSKTGKPTRTLVEKLRHYNYGIRTNIADRFAALESFTRALKERSGQALRRSHDPYVLARVYDGTADAFARTAIERGVFSLETGKRLSKGIVHILQSIKPEEVENFLRFAIARHAREVWAKGKNPGFAKEDVEAVYQKHKGNATWEKAADELTDWNKALIYVLWEAGGLSSKSAAAIIESYPHYLPLKRVLDAVKESGIPTQIANVRAPVFRLKGSGADVVHPLASMVQSAVQIYNVATKLRVGRAIVRAAQGQEGMGEWVEQIPAPTETTKVKLEKIAGQIADAGGDLANADLEAIISITQASGFYRGGEPIAMIMLNGKPRWFQFHPELYDAITRTGLDDAAKVLDALGPLGDVLQAATKVKRAGATGFRASFGLFFNPARDFFTAMMQTEGSAMKMLYRMPLNVVRIPIDRIMESLGKGYNPDLVLWREFGGELSGFIGQDIRQAYKQVGEVMRSAHGRKAHHILMDTPSFVQKVLSIPEAAPRLAEFRATLDRYGISQAELRHALEAGAPLPMDAIIEAIHNANEVTIDFRRKGKVMGVLNRVEAYSNARLQGIFQPIRKFESNPRRFLLRGFSMLTLPTIAYWLLHKDEDWYQELPPWLKWFFWNFKAGNEVVRIPRPFEIGLVFSAIPEAVLDSWYRQDPNGVNDAIAESVGADFLDGKQSAANIAFMASEYMLPDGVQPALEALLNYDLWRRRAIVGEQQQSREPRDQFYDYNTAASQYFGDVFNLSPAKLDHMLGNYTGGMGTDVARIPEEGPLRALGFGRVFRLVDRGVSVDDFYAQLQDVTQRYNSAKDRGDVDADLRDRFRLYNDYADLMRELRKAAGGTGGKRNVYDKYITGLARDALGADELEAYPNPLKTEDLPDALKAVVEKYLGNKAYLASAPATSDETKERAETSLAMLRRLGLSEKRAVSLMKAAAKRQGLNTTLYASDGDLTAYGQRTQRLKAALD